MIIQSNENAMVVYRDTDYARSHLLGYAARQNKRCVWRVRQWHNGKWRDIATVRGEQSEADQLVLVKAILSTLVLALAPVQR